MADNKRKRKPNWTKDQQLLLAKQVNKRKLIIKGKFGIGITTKSKKEAWESIRMEINSAFPLLPRTTDECEKRWFSLQSHARQEIAEYKRQTAATGGGTAPKELSPIASVVYSILGYSDTSITGLQGCIDPAMQLLDELEGANSSAATQGNAPGSPPGSCPLPPGPLLFLHPSPGPAPDSPPAVCGGPAPSASLEQQKLELEISLLKKQHAVLDQQERLFAKQNLHIDKQDRVLKLQEEYYSHQLKMLKE
ncbi:hypothetical protein AAFF_G00205670 [Aldrovandia affinis]|uniref:Myb-like domain-containing protein n=1 Tax=Aldrovandia affinis TaxID=143900 RepID=A0AAD7W6B2_9TELE|nr:hypothetical protein AAFF_G00205670 [Aldrovandia affinis]